MERSLRNGSCSQDVNLGGGGKSLRGLKRRLPSASSSPARSSPFSLCLAFAIGIAMLAAAAIPTQALAASPRAS